MAHTIEVWKVTKNDETVKTFKYWEKDKALKYAHRIASKYVKVFVFEDDEQIWSNQK